MATHSTGITVTFSSQTFAEVTGLTWSWGSGLPKGRSAIWTDAAGSATVECFGAVGTSIYGTRGTFTVAGGGMTLTATACCTSVSASAELNGVTRVTATFDFIQ